MKHTNNMKIPFLSLKEVTALHGAEIQEAVRRVTESGWYLQGVENEKFEHEMYLQIREGYKNYLISGCSHKGLINLIYAFRFDAMIGGFHFMKYEVLWDEDRLLDAAKAIRNSCADYYTCHCTGSEQYQFLKDEIGEKMHYIACGDTIVLE